MDEKLITQLEVTGENVVLNKIREVKKELIALQEVNKKLTKTEKEQGTQVEENKAKIISLQTELRKYTKELAQQITANKNLGNSMDVITSKATQMKTAFGVAAQALKGVQASGGIGNLTSIFPGAGDLGASQMKTLTTAYAQAQAIGDNFFDMQSVAAKVFKNDMNQVSIAVASYNELLEKNPGVDAITLNTAALIALKNQVTSVSASVSGLNKELANVAAGNFKLAVDESSKSVNLLENDIKNVQKTLGELNSSAISQINFLNAIEEASVSSKILNEELLSVLRTFDAINKGQEIKLNSNIFKAEDLEGYATSINGLRLQLTTLQKSFETLSATERKSDIGKETIAKIKALQIELNETNALTARVGKGGFNSLNMGVQQLARELPNLAISSQIFFMSISNNLPMLADGISEFKKMRQAVIDNNKEFGKNDKVPSMFKAITGSIFSLGGALTLVSGLLLIFSDDISRITKELFKGKEAIDYTSESLKALLKVTSDYSGTAKTTIKDVQELGLQLEKYGGDVKYQTQLVKDFNEMFGTHLKTIGEVKKSYKPLADEFINNAVRMQAAMALLEKSSNAMLDAQNARLQISSFKKEDLDAAYSTGLKLAGLAEKMGFSEDFITKQIEGGKGFENIYKSVFDKIEKSKAAASRGGVSFVDKDAEDFINLYKNFEKIQGANTIIKVTSQLGEAKKKLELYNSEAKKLIGPPKIDKPTAAKDYKEAKIYSDPEVVRAEKVAREVIKWTNWVVQEKSFAQKAEEKVIERKLANDWRYGDSALGALRSDREIMLGEITDVTLEMQKARVDMFKAENKKTFFAQASDDLKIAYDRVDEFNSVLAKNKTKLNEAELVLQKLNDEYSKSPNEKAAKAKALEIKAQEKVIKGIKDENKSIEDYLKSKEKEIERIKKNLEEYKSGTEEYEQAQQKLINLELEHDRMKELLHQNDKKRYLETVNIIQDYLGAISEVYGGINSIVQGSMDLTNAKYDKEKWLIEENVTNEKDREDQLYAIEMRRYKELKKQFEFKKKVEEANVIMNTASGIISIWKGYAETTPGPVGAILAGIQTVALTANAIGQINTIRAQQLEAPHKPGGGSGGSGSSGSGYNVALNPTKDAMTSKDDQLNSTIKQTIKDQPQQKVLVSDINDIQAKVAVRQENSSF